MKEKRRRDGNLPGGCWCAVISTHAFASVSVSGIVVACALTVVLLVLILVSRVHIVVIVPSIQNKKNKKKILATSNVSSF